MTAPALARRPVAAPRALRRYGAVNWLGAATLVRREIGRNFKLWPISLIGPVLSMMLYMLIFALALGPERGTARGEAVLDFIAPGLVLFVTMQRAAEAGTFSLMLDKLEGMIGDILVSPLNAAEMTTAYMLSGGMAGLATGTAVMTGMLLFGGLPVTAPLLALPVALLAAAVMALFGVLAGLWARKWDHVAVVFSFIIVPLGFLSGLFAPVSEVPEPFATLIRLNPMYYAIDAFRGALTGVHVVSVPASLAILAGTVATLWALCFLLIRRGYNLKH